MQLRQPDDTLNPRILQLVSAARRAAEEATNRALAPQTWDVVADAFPPCASTGIRLPAPPVAELLQASYVDPNGAPQPLASSAVLLDADSEPGWLFPAPGTTWPATRSQPNAVRLQVACGYPLGQLPEPIREWILLHVAAWFENPGAVGDTRLVTMPYVHQLLQPFRVITLAD